MQRIMLVTLVLFSSILIYPLTIGRSYSDVVAFLLSSRLHHHSICESPHYAVRMLSYDPLIIHLEGFLTAKERQHLWKIG